MGIFPDINHPAIGVHTFMETPGNEMDVFQNIVNLEKIDTRFLFKHLLKETQPFKLVLSTFTLAFGDLGYDKPTCTWR